MYTREFFDYEKAIEVFLYIVTKYPNVDPFYFLKDANIYSLYEYGRTICGQNNIEPCEFECLISFLMVENFNTDIVSELGDRRFSPLRKCNEDFLSKSDKKCLQKAFDNYDLDEY